MFPLHEDTIFTLAIVAVGAFMAVFTATRGWKGLWQTAIIFVVGVVWPWPVAAYLGLDGYTLTVAFYLSVWTTVALIAGAVWGLIARLAVAGTVSMIAVALFPPLAGSAYVLERQRVPDAACAAEVEVHIGNLRLAVPRELGIRSVATDEAHAQVWEGVYSDWPGAKPDVRALCGATGGGRTPVEVSHLWLSFSWFRRDLDTACESDTDLPRFGTACAAAARTTPTVVQFYARPDGIASPSPSHFNESLITQARSQGEVQRYRCNDSTTGPGTRYCTSWYQLSPEILAVSSAKLGAAQNVENPPADLAILLDALIGSLTLP